MSRATPPPPSRVKPTAATPTTKDTTAEPTNATTAPGQPHQRHDHTIHTRNTATPARTPTQGHGTSCIFVMIVELTLATIFVLFGICSFSPVCTSTAALLANVVLSLWIFVLRHCIHCGHYVSSRFQFLLCTQKHTKAQLKCSENGFRKPLQEPIEIMSRDMIWPGRGPRHFHLSFEHTGQLLCNYICAFACTNHKTTGKASQLEERQCFHTPTGAMKYLETLLHIKYHPFLSKIILYAHLLTL